MEGYKMGFNLEKTFKDIAPIAQDIFSSFAKKGNTDNVTWLAQIFAQNEHTAQNAEKLTEEVYSTVARFSANMHQINQACKTGKTKEQWLKEYIENNTDLTPQQKFEYLAQANSALSLGNQVMSEIMQSPNTIEITDAVNELMQQDLPAVDSNQQANRYAMADIVKQIEQQAELMGNNGAMFPLDMQQMPSEEILQEDFTEEESGSGLDEGLKMAATAALKIGHVAGKIPFLPKNTPITAITNIACVGVESVKNIGRVATGKITPMQALENIGRATVSAAANFISTGIPAKLLTPIPVIGPALSIVAGGVLMRCSSQAIQKKIYAGIEKVKPVAKKIATNIGKALNKGKETIVNIGKGIFNRVANIFS